MKIEKTDYEKKVQYVFYLKDLCENEADLYIHLTREDFKKQNINKTIEDLQKALEQEGIEYQPFETFEA